MIWWIAFPPLEQIEPGVRELDYIQAYHNCTLTEFYAIRSSCNIVTVC